RSRVTLRVRCVELHATDLGRDADAVGGGKGPLVVRVLRQRDVVGAPVDAARELWPVLPPGDAPTVPRVATDVQVREVAARLQLRGREELAVVVVEAES